MQVLKFTSRKAINIKKMVCQTTPYFASVCITFVNSKPFFKASGRPNTLLTITFAGYQSDKTSTDNISGIKVVKSILDARQDQFPSTACIIEALKLCLECDNSSFNNKHFLQSDGTTQGPHMSCSYSSIVIQYFDVKALEYTPATIYWKDLGMIFLLSGHIVLTNLIYFLIT